MTSDHYQTLQVHHLAGQADIKKAYRQLVKRYHPDCNPDGSAHDRMAAINAAYEVLGNPQSRSSYDRTLGISRTRDIPTSHPRQSTGQDEDEKFAVWTQQVYEPINNILEELLDGLDDQIDELAADPFDDELMGNFQAYLDESRRACIEAQRLLRKLPNPVAAAGVAAYLYHAIHQLGDGIEELNYFSFNFDDRHLHTGQELWRIAEELRDDAESSMQTLLIRI